VAAGRARRYGGRGELLLGAGALIITNDYLRGIGVVAPFPGLC
jgi:hypothetical protein